MKDLSMASNSKQLSPQAKNETGKKYGKLTVLEFSHVKRTVHWICQCECGNTVVAAGHHLRAGTVTTCGCAHRKSNGMSGSPVYKVWQAMKSRCYNPKDSHYRNYGARGITVIDRWLESFSNFFDDMGERPFVGATLERVDNSKGYSKANCKWATRHEQMANTRASRILTYNGETKCIAEWARSIGVNSKTIHYRLNQGWPLAKALTTPATPAEERTAKMLTFNKETRSLTGWARKLGINHASLCERLANGWPLEKALTTPGRKLQEATHDGETLTIPDWGRKLRMRPRTIARRLDQGWTMDEIVEHYSH